MKTLLLTAVLLGLVAALQAQEPLSILSEAQSLSGTWHIKAVASQMNMNSEYKMKQVFPVKILALEGEDLEVTITILYDGGCHDMKFQMKKTDEPGKYIDLSTKNVMNVERLPVKDYAIFLCEGQHEGKLFRIAKLMGKNPEENPEALEQFKKFTQRKGFQQESIYVPKQEDACVSENN